MSDTKKSERTYGQWCPIAAGLDVLGDRWVLMICRELMMGPRRFTDLRGALPGLAPNLLTERLRALQAEGLVETAELPPPAARTVYQLTADGREVAPILRSIARFGAGRLQAPAPPAFNARRALHALVLPWRRSVEAHLRVRLVLQRRGADDDVADLVLAGLESSVGAPEGEADVTLTTSADELAAVRRNTGARLVAEVRGSAADRKAMLAALGLPGVVSGRTRSTTNVGFV